MNARRFVPLIAVLCPLLTASADDAAPKGDLAKFQGKWTAKVGPEKDISLRVEIKGNSVVVSGSTPNGDEFEVKGELKLDEAAKPFKSLDWVKFAGPNGDEIPDNKGIYELVNADTIKVCNGGPGNDRPAEFKDGDGENPSVTVLKRVRD